MDLTSPFPFRHQRTVHMPKPLEISVNPFQEQTGPNDSNTNENPSQSSKSVPPSLHLDISNDNISGAPFQNESEFEQPFPESGTQISPSFLPPRSPLPPTKLANIANALGVNTPMPATYVRSPSPSTFRSPSRFLLHIVPPPFLPSDDDDDPTLSSSPHGASTVSVNSYRSQFRRGTLVPLYPTLRSQLGAIAREYSLPSTGGLILYLSQTGPDGTSDGPRISDEVWKLLWYRALMVERQDQLGVGGNSRAPSALALRSGNMTPSSAVASSHLNRDFSSSSLSSLSTTPTPTPVHALNPTDAPSDTDTSTSTSTSNPSPSTSTTNTGFTSLDHDSNRNTPIHAHPDLLAIASELTPNPFLPILAKVEFDIDLRKAKWYDSWLKSRKERARWKANNNNNSANVNSVTTPHPYNPPSSRVAPLPLELPDLAKSRSRLNSLALNSDEEPGNEDGRAAAINRIGYALLDADGDSDHDPDQERTAVEADDDDDPENNNGEVDTTVKMPIPLPKGKAAARDNDPLADVFGTDSDTWAALRYESPGTRKKRPQDPALIIADEDANHDGDGDQNEPKHGNSDGDDEEVLKLWNEHLKPTLKLSPGNSSSAQSMSRRPAPPPLKIAPPPLNTSGTEAQAHNLYSGPRSAFPVMQRSFSETVLGNESNKNEKRMKHRTGIVLNDGEGLGLGNVLRAGKLVEEPVELNQGEDDRSSQIIMKQKLDILEKQLAQLTPRKLTAPSPPLPPLPSGSSPSPTHKEKEGTTASPTPSPLASPRRRLSIHTRGRSSLSSSGSSRSHLEHQLPQSVIHGQYNSKVKGSITPPNSVVKSTERTPPHVTIRPASGAVSIATTGSGSGSGFLERDNGIEGSGTATTTTTTESEMDDGQDFIILPSTRGSSLSSGPNRVPTNIPDSPPLLPLSPDPFGRRTMEDSMRMESEQERGAHSSLPPVPPSVSAVTTLEPREPSNGLDTNGTFHSIAMTLNQQSPGEKQSSRFSADSEQSIEAAVNSSKQYQKRPRSNSIMSVRGLRNLWRKSAAASSNPGMNNHPSSSGGGLRSGVEPPLPPLPALDSGLPTPPLSSFTPGAAAGSSDSSTPRGSVLSQHSREESSASVKSLSRTAQQAPPAQPQLRPKRPSVSPIPRPDSGGDPFQFDSVLYKSPSTPSLLSGTNSSNSSNQTGQGTSYHKSGASSVSSKGILKNWSGSSSSIMTTSSMTDVTEVRRMRVHQQQSALGLRRPSESRPESTASAASDRSASDSRKSSVPSPPPSPPKARRSTSQSRLLQLQQSEPPNPRTSLNGPSHGMSHSLPTGTLMGLSRLGEFPAPPNGLADESFEVIPSRRLTPSASYSGDIL